VLVPHQPKKNFFTFWSLKISKTCDEFQGCFEYFLVPMFHSTLLSWINTVLDKVETMLYPVQHVRMVFWGSLQIQLKKEKKRILIITMRFQGALFPRCNSTLMRDSLPFRGSVLWNLFNHNDKTTNLNLKETKARFTVINSIFDSSTALTSWYRKSDYVYF